MVLRHYLEFETSLEPIDEQVALIQSRLQSVPDGMSTSELDAELEKVHSKLHALLKDIHSQLTPWQRIQLSRHPARPYALDYQEGLIEGFVEIHGDRLYAEDPAIVCGVGRLLGKRTVAFIGQQKGRNTKQKVHRNFGMPKPEGYRKAFRVMELAERFHLPILALIDTPGAYPGIGAEERGQSMAIAENLVRMMDLRTQVVCVVIGEGGSGGALAIAMGDRVFMLENAVYSVISPESCAAILWSDASQAERAAKELKISAQDALRFKVIEAIIPEPPGGAHRHMPQVVQTLGDFVEKTFAELEKKSMDDLLAERFSRFRNLGNLL